MNITRLLCSAAVLVGAAIATPVSYQVQFAETTHFGVLPTVSFDYESSQANPFSNFRVQWDGARFYLIDFAGMANRNTDFNYSSACLGGQTGGQATFALLTNCPGAYWMGESSDNLTFFMFCAADGSDGIGGLISSVSGPNDRVFGADPVFGSFHVVPVSQFQAGRAEVPEPSYSLVILAVLFLWMRRRILLSRLD
jgi:hypothetical protein